MTEKRVIGWVSGAIGFEPTSTHCYIAIDKNFVEDKSLFQHGNVFEIFEGESDRCFGIAERAEFKGTVSAEKEYYSLSGVASFNA